MARMYKSRKGQSGSSRPHVKEAPEWSETDKDTVQSLILDLAKTGLSTAEIGTVLRDKHAVPNVRLVLGKRIGQVLAENDMLGTYPEDMMNLMRQAVAIINHLGSGNHNPKEMYGRIFRTRRPFGANHAARAPA